MEVLKFDVRKIIFINRYFYPDHSATAQLLSDLVFHIKGDNTQTHIITSRQRYDRPKTALPSEEVVRDVHVHRVWTTQFGRYNNYGRAIDYASFYFTSMVRLLRLTNRGDILVAKTDPPLILIPAAIVAWLRSAYLINWLQDIFPEVAERLGIRYINGTLCASLRWIRNRGLKAARQNIVIGNKMAEYLYSEGVRKERVTVIDNWVNSECVRPVSRKDNVLFEEWGLHGKYVVGYSGNLGRAHDFDTILDAAEILLSNPKIVFIFIGGGVKLGHIQEQCLRRGLNNVLFKPYQPRERLSESLSVPDVHLISLKPDMEGLVVPSKFYGVVAVGKPMIYVGDDNGEIAQKIRAHKCGVTVRQGDSNGLAEVISKLSNNATLNSQMSRYSRAIGEDAYSLSQSLLKWKKIFQDEFSLDLTPHLPYEKS